MASDIEVSRLDVVKEYASRLKVFRTVMLACGVALSTKVSKAKHNLSGVQASAKKRGDYCKKLRDSIVERYRPIRIEPLPGSEIAGDTDHQIESKYQELSDAINDYNRDIEAISAKLTEIKQLTKTFCAILDSETLASARKLEEMTLRMDEMCNIKIDSNVP